MAVQYPRYSSLRIVKSGSSRSSRTGSARLVMARNFTYQCDTSMLVSCSPFMSKAPVEVPNASSTQYPTGLAMKGRMTEAMLLSFLRQLRTRGRRHRGRAGRTRAPQPAPAASRHKYLAETASRRWMPMVVLNCMMWRAIMSASMRSSR